MDSDPGSSSLWAITLVKLLLVSICAYLSAVFSGSEVAILSLNRIRLLELSEGGDKRAGILMKILDRPSELVSTLLAGNTTVNVMMVVLWTSILLEILESPTIPKVWAFSSSNSISTELLIVGGGSLFLTAFIIIMCEVFPKNLFHRNAESQALARAGFLMTTIKISKPLVILANSVSRLLLKIVGITLSHSASPITEEEIIDLIDTGKEKGLIKHEEREMIHSIFEFGDLKVKDIMIPRVDMDALSVRASLKDAMNKIMNTGHSRLPVYGEDRDDIIGLLYAKDLLAKLGRKDSEKITLDKIHRGIEFVPEEMPLSDLFSLLKRKKIHLAIVVDEYGGTAGLVTIEDVLEELVGEIEDEFDKAEPLFKESGEVWIVDGKMNLHDLESLTDVDLPENGADTVGGLILHKLERMPREGDEIEIGSLLFKVKAVRKQRIKEIEVKKLTIMPPEIEYDEDGE